MYTRPPCVQGSAACVSPLDPEGGHSPASEPPAELPRAPSQPSDCKTYGALGSLDASDSAGSAAQKSAAEAQLGVMAHPRIPSASPEEVLTDLPLQGLASVEQALHSIYLRSVLVPCDCLQRNLDGPSRAFASSSAGSVLFSRFLIPLLCVSSYVQQCYDWNHQ